MNQGKVQVFPRVDKSKYGIGRGATIDLEIMDLKDLITLREMFNKTVDTRIERGNQ